MRKKVQSELLATFKAFGGQYDAYKLFNDFITMSALSTSNGYDKRNYEEREAIYMTTIKGYSKKQLNHFVKAFALLRDALISHPHDYLGDLFMGMELGSKLQGQFFTPMHICRMMAKIELQKVDQCIEENGFITVCDPCTGGGAMLIAFADEMQLAGYNYPTQLYCMAQDIDIKSVYMTYIQLSWMGVGCKVNHGDSLMNKVNSSWLSPWNIIHGWESRVSHSMMPEKQKVKDAEFVKEASLILTPNSIDNHQVHQVQESEQLMFFDF